MKSSICNIGNVITDKEGNYKYQFIISGASSTEKNKYSARISNDVGEYKELMFDYISPNDNKIVLDTLNKSNTKEKIYEFISTYGNGLYVDMISYNSFSEEIKTAVQEVLIKKLPFSTLNDFKVCFDDVVLTKKLAGVSDISKYKEILKSNSKILKSLETKTFLENITDTQRETIYLEIFNKRLSYGSVNELYEDVCFKTIITLINTTYSKDSIIISFSDYYDYFILKNNNFKDKIDTLNSLDEKKKISVSEYILSQKPQEISALYTTLENAMKPDDSHSDGGGSTNSTSGGGRENSYIPKGTVSADASVLNKTVFNDIDTVPWAKSSIENLYAKGIVNGNENGYFMPNNNITREEFIKILICAFDCVDNNATSTFSDVDNKAWYYKYVATAQKLDIAKGNNNLFGIRENITRQDMAVMIDRMLFLKKKNLADVNEKKTFEDMDKMSDYSKDAINKMQIKGVINGFDDNTFRPLDFATKAQCAKMIDSIIGGQL